MNSDLPSLPDYWAQRVERDLAPFIDPNTTVSVTRAGRVISASWVQRQTPREATFSVSPESIDVSTSGRTIPYRAFFASAEMADLLNLAKMTLQARRSGLYVQTLGRRVGESEDGATPAAELIRTALSDPWASDATLVVMVTGEAGAGKTSVLEELVRTQADRYARGQAQSLFLYVNAQGRALARFQEALATELQDLRATLTYHAVSTLVRLGLLVPVIDGFDELLGVGGYDDAFSSLATFIEELDGSGQLIASARSTYYEQEFVARANRVSGLGSQVWKQIPIEVRSWGQDERRRYLELFASSKGLQKPEADALSDAVLRVFDKRNDALGKKPLFVARATQLVLDGVDLRPEGDLLGQMVDAYLDRESGKLLDRTGARLLSPEQIRSLFVDLAEEMWNQETRELDPRSVREIAEYALVTEDVAASTQQIVVAKMPSLAFLRTGERPGSITFEHEIFYAFFLGLRFAGLIGGATVVPATLLGRSVLPDDVAEIATLALAARFPDVGTGTVLDRLGAAASLQSPRAGQVRENAGLLMASLLRRRCVGAEPCTGFSIRHVVVPGQHLDGVYLRNVVLEDVSFRRVDLTRTRIAESSARNVSLLEVLVDPMHTRLELAGLDHAQVVGLRSVAIDGGRPLFDPGDVDLVLRQIGAVNVSQAAVRPTRSIAKEQLKLLERFVRAYNRANPVCTSDDFMRSVFNHQDWSELQKLLVTSGVVSEETRNTGGHQKVFLRRQVLTEELVAGANPNADVPHAVRVFWDAVEKKFPG